MKFLKLLSIVAVSAMSMSLFAQTTNSAEANIKVTATGTTYADEIDLYQNETAPSDFTGKSNAPDSYSSINDYCVNLWIVGDKKNYASVKMESLVGLVIKFKANNHNTSYKMSFAYLKGDAITLKRGEETITMTSDYDFTCALNEEVTFTVSQVGQGTAVEEVAEVVENNKTIENGQLIIMKNGVKHNAQGIVIE